jgi:hypothetical protein
VTNDKWFFRTWAFQEKLSAKFTRILFPIARDPHAISVSRSLEVGADTCINLEVMCEIARNLAVRENLWGRMDGELEKMLEGRPVRRLEQAIDRLDTSGCLPTPRRLLLSQIYDIHGKMEDCDNSVTADRLAILANICDLAHRLKSTALGSSTYSYSTCLLLLIFANLWPNHGKRLQKYNKLLLMTGLMDLDIGGALYSLAKQTSAQGLEVELSNESHYHSQDLTEAHRSGRTSPSLSYEARTSTRPRSAHSRKPQDEWWPNGSTREPDWLNVSDTERDVVSIDTRRKARRMAARINKPLNPILQEQPTPRRSAGNGDSSLERILQHPKNHLSYPDRLPPPPPPIWAPTSLVHSRELCTTVSVAGTARDVIRYNLTPIQQIQPLKTP